MGTHLREPIESYPMNTNMRGVRCFSKVFASLTTQQSVSSIHKLRRSSMCWLIVLIAIRECLYNLALADVLSTGAEIKYLYCISGVTGETYIYIYIFIYIHIFI